MALFERDEIEDAVEALIAYMDARGGDPEAETGGNEDDFVSHPAEGPGCPIADPDCCAEDGRHGCGDPGWTEWQTRKGRKLDTTGAEIVGRDRWGCLLEEDTEDDDPREANGDELDTGNAEDDHGLVSTIHGWSAGRGTPGGGAAGCPIADGDGEPAWIEWQTRGRHKLDTYGAEIVCRDGAGNMLREDDEDDDPDTGVEDGPRGFDPEEDLCLAGEDRIAAGPVIDRGQWLAGSPRMSRYDDARDIEDAEREQMANDVPSLPVFAIEPNAFSGRRELLGRSNLMSSFRTNGGEEVSADTGRIHRTRGTFDRRSGMPV